VVLSVRKEAGTELQLSVRREADAHYPLLKARAHAEVLLPIRAVAKVPLLLSVAEEADDEFLLPVSCQERGESAEVVLTCGKRQALKWYREEESTEVLLAVRKEARC
jgi:hypothetical protein